MFSSGERSDLWASQLSTFHYGAMLFYWMQYARYHYLAEICKAFDEKDAAWMGAYVVLYLSALM